MTRVPYPGLRPFQRDEVDVFFGRERHIDRMLATLEAHRFLAVTGASGAGKSSLVRTGLYSALQLGYLSSIGSRWRIIEARPGNHPLAALCDAIIDTLGDRSDPLERGLLDAALARSPEAVGQALGAMAAERKQALLLVIDQFEEMFRFRSPRTTDDEAYAFVSMLLSLARQRDVPIFVVLTLRSDFLGECAQYDGLAEMVNEALFLTPQMDRDELGEAIAMPARVFGGSVEPRLTNAILNDLEGQQDQLPLTQHALSQLWGIAAGKNPDAPELTLQSYLDIGGAAGALDLHGAAILAELGPLAPLAEQVFRQLCGGAGGKRDVRNPTRFGDLQEATGASREDLTTVIGAFRRPDRSFLTPVSGELTPDRMIDITHESLIRQWGKLRDWAKDEASDAAQYARIVDSAVLNRRDEAALLVSPDIDNALAWRARVQPNEAWAQRYDATRPVREDGRSYLALALDFIARSETAKAEHEAQSKLAADTATRAAADERRRERAARRARIATLAVALVLVAGTALIIYIFGLWQQADDARTLAEKNAETADSLRLLADVARGEAQARAAEIAAQQVEFRREQLEAAGTSILNAARTESIQGSRERTLALIGEARRFAAQYGGDVEGLDARMEAAIADILANAPAVYPAIETDIRRLPGANGFLGATRWAGLTGSGPTTALGLWSTLSGTRVRSVSADGDVQLAATRDGSDTLVLLRADGALGLVSLTAETPQILWTPRPGASRITAMALAALPEGEVLMVAAGDRLQLWDLTSTGLTLRQNAELDVSSEIRLPTSLTVDEASGRFILASQDGPAVLGTVGEVLTLDSELPISFVSAGSLAAMFDRRNDRIVILNAGCLISVPEDSLVVPDGMVERAPLTGDVYDCNSTNAEGAQLLYLGDYLDNYLMFDEAWLEPDGETLVVLGNGSLSYIDALGDNLTDSLLQVASPVTGGLLADVGRSSSGAVAIVDTRTSFVSIDRPDDINCAACTVVGRLDDETVLVAREAGAGLLTADGLWALPTGFERHTMVLGFSPEGDAVALATEDRDEPAVLDLQTRALTPLTPVDDLSALAAGSGAPTRVFIDGQSAHFDGAWGTGQIRQPGISAVSGDGTIAAREQNGRVMIIEITDTGTVTQPVSGTAIVGMQSLVFADSQTLFALDASGRVHRIDRDDTGWVSSLFDDELARSGGTQAADQRPSMQLSATGEAVTIVVDGVADTIALDGTSRTRHRALSTGITWAGTLGADFVMLGRDGWIWRAPLRPSPEFQAIAEAAIASTALPISELETLLLFTEVTEDRLTRRLGSPDCAAEIAAPRIGEDVPGCPDMVAMHPGEETILLAHALALLEASRDAGATERGTRNPRQLVEDAQMLLVAAARAGSSKALTLLADEMSPPVARLRASGLLPESGWAATVALLESLYPTDAALPAAVVELIAEPGDDPALVAARSLWTERIAETRYDADPVANLARVVVAEGAGASRAESTRRYLSVLGQLTAPTNTRAEALARQRLARLIEDIDPQDFAAARLASAALPSAEPAAVPLTIEPSLAAYFSIRDTAAAGPAIRREAVRAALVELAALFTELEQLQPEVGFQLAALGARLSEGATLAETQPDIEALRERLVSLSEGAGLQQPVFGDATLIDRASAVATLIAASGGEAEANFAAARLMEGAIHFVETRLDNAQLAASVLAAAHGEVGLYLVNAALATPSALDAADLFGDSLAARSKQVELAAEAAGAAPHDVEAQYQLSYASAWMGYTAWQAGKGADSMRAYSMSMIAGERAHQLAPFDYAFYYASTLADGTLAMLRTGDTEKAFKIVGIVEALDDPRFDPASAGAGVMGRVLYGLAEVLANATEAYLNDSGTRGLANDCDALASMANDPLRRANPSTAADMNVDGALTACVQVIETAEEQIDVARATYQLAQVVRAVEATGETVEGQIGQELLLRAAELGYPAAWLALYDQMGISDYEKMRYAAGYYNTIMRTGGQMMTYLAEAGGDVRYARLIEFVRSEISQINRLDFTRSRFTADISP